MSGTGRCQKIFPSSSGGKSSRCSGPGIVVEDVEILRNGRRARTADGAWALIRAADFEPPYLSFVHVPESDWLPKQQAGNQGSEHSLPALRFRPFPTSKRLNGRDCTYVNPQPDRHVITGDEKPLGYLKTSSI